jgi:hypothetical protein
MLYDPKWEQKTADPFNLDTLIAWLEKQPAAKEYNYQNACGECLLGQYMAAHGISWSAENYMPFHDNKQFTRVAFAFTGPNGAISTFGAALARALQQR